MLVDTSPTDEEWYSRGGQRASPEEGRRRQQARSGEGQLHRALSDLREAAGRHDVESLCAAYHLLRGSANGGDVQSLHQIASQALGFDLRRVIIDAYASRGCFMCRRGFVPCESCEGRGALDGGRKCGQCGGLGGTVCDFCGGTGWVDRETIPGDIRLAVVRRQLDRVGEQMKQLAREARYQGRNAQALSSQERNRLARAAIRLRARIQDLARLGLSQESETRRRFLTAADGLIKRLADMNTWT